MSQFTQPTGTTPRRRLPCWRVQQKKYPTIQAFPLEASEIMLESLQGKGQGC